MDIIKVTDFKENGLEVLENDIQDKTKGKNEVFNGVIAVGQVAVIVLLVFVRIENHYQIEKEAIGVVPKTSSIKKVIFLKMVSFLNDLDGIEVQAVV